MFIIIIIIIIIIIVVIVIIIIIIIDIYISFFYHKNHKICLVCPNVWLVVYLSRKRTRPGIRPSLKDALVPLDAEQ